MQHLACDVVFFDIGGTLGLVSLSADRTSIERIQVFPYVPEILRHLVECLGLNLGVISDPGPIDSGEVHRALKDAGLFSWIDERLVILGSKQTSAIFGRAADRAGVPRARCLFVGEDARERERAKAAGYAVAPHPTLAIDAARGRELSFVRIRVPAGQEGKDWWWTLQAEPVVPLHATRTGSQPELLAIVSDATALRLGAMRFAVDHLRGDPATTDVYLLRDDRRERTGDLQPISETRIVFAGDADRILSHAPEGTVVALDAHESVEEYHFAEAGHGHTLKLMPDLGLLRPFGALPGGEQAGFLAALAAVAPPPLEDAERRELQKIDAARINRHLDRYGFASRHIAHPDNARAVSSLAADLEEIGRGRFFVRLSPFTHEGQTLLNVEAELAGTSGDADVRESLVLVSAHLDSTAAFTPGFDPASGPAPGADDDLSGVVAVLAIAEVIREVAETRPPARTVRFLLFNAEEHGLVGSKAYARAQRLAGAPIVGVYQMDMIGYRGKNEKPFPFEVHLGAPGAPDVQDRSLALLQRIKAAVPLVGPPVLTGDPQVYADPDPAAGRSDHASFHQQGYAGCVLSEDFFPGPLATSPDPQQNEHYHRETDTRAHIDPDYLAAIARVVAAAVLMTAKA